MTSEPERLYRVVFERRGWIDYRVGSVAEALAKARAGYSAAPAWDEKWEPLWVEHPDGTIEPVRTAEAVAGTLRHSADISGATCEACKGTGTEGGIVDELEQQPNCSDCGGTGVVEPPSLRAALQWLLDDMNDCGETHSNSGALYDSVENAAKALIAAGGSLNWYPPSPLHKAVILDHDDADYDAQGNLKPGCDHAREG